ncbi:hypothetical protein FB107DRAFT_215665, partial [Schizophyllum commune]
YYPTCTCRMAPDGALDNRMRVHGVRRLRVCDASAFPTIALGHTAGACFAIAEKLADDLKAGFARCIIRLRTLGLTRNRPCMCTI